MLLMVFSVLLALVPATFTSGFHIQAPHSDKISPNARSLNYRSTPDDDDATNPLVHVDVLDTVGVSKAPVDRSPWHATSKKKWGVEEESPREYWYDSRIHTLGNTGFFGALHAAIAPLSTKMIDKLAYEGVDVREQVSKKLYEHVQTSGARVLDLCCGVGISTRALHSVFSDAESVVGIDTSPEMISMAQAVSKQVSFIRRLISLFNAKASTILSAASKQSKQAQAAYNEMTSNCDAAFIQGNAERTELPTGSFDLVTIMYAFHEAPKEGRKRMLREVHRLLKDGGTMALIDISPDYEPSPAMLAGEPYCLEYLENIQKQMHSIAGFTNVVHESIVPGHVSMWRLTCSKHKFPFLAAA